MTWEQEVKEKGVTDITPLAQGKRGVVYDGTRDGENIIIKVKREDSTAPARMRIEAHWLTKLNEHGIGPQLLFFGDNYLVYKKINGVLIVDYLASASLNDCVRVLKKLFDIMYTMDTLGINKEEMHRPVKHVYVDRDSVHMIDFERCNLSHSPHNVTQLVQFVTGPHVKPILESYNIIIDREKITEFSKKYKEKLVSCLANKKSTAEKEFQQLLSILFP